MPYAIRLFVASLLLASVALFAMPATPRASAGGVLWCRADPVIMVDGQLIEFHLAIPLDALPRVTGPTRYIVKTPPGVSRVVVLNDAGFNLHGSEIRFADGKPARKGRMKIEIIASVQTDAGRHETIPMEITVVPVGALPMSALGTTERTVLRTTLAVR